MGDTPSQRPGRGRAGDFELESIVRVGSATKPMYAGAVARNQRREQKNKELALVSGEERKYWRDARQSACFWQFVISLLGLLVAVAENEWTWHGGHHGVEFNLASEALKATVVGTTLVAYYLLYKYYEALISIRRLAGIFLPPGVTVRSLRGAGLWNQMLFDVIILCPQPIPMVDSQISMWNKGLGRYSVYELDTVLTCFMMIRFYYLPRFYGECLSEFTSEAVVAFGNMNKVTLNADFVLRFVLANRLNVVFCIAILQVTIFSYLMMVMERPTDAGTLQNFANCVWLIIITMTTVGYGDEYPTTSLGRVVSILASITAVIMLAVTINLVISKVSLDRNESQLINVIDRISLRTDMRRKATVVIQRWIRALLAFTNQHGQKNKQGYVVIEENFKSTKRKNLELRAQVMSNVGMLVAINDFRECAQASFVTNMDGDLPTMVGELHSKLELQNDMLTDLATKVLEVQELVDSLASDAAASAHVLY
ncbi:hypothetical protein T484DRAFT_1902179 [Baffinella frigidus]|nr:hypothetical protein T484DRAFT_1902179 [Cryptophyta sp. CCMP2293]